MRLLLESGHETKLESGHETKLESGHETTVGVWA